MTGPTCTTGGYTTYTCSVCGDSYTDNETEATGHSWDEGTVTTAATCTEDGEKTYTCAVCGETKTETIMATGHSYEAVVTEPTCIKDGYTTHTCTICGHSYTDSEIAATGHSYESVVTDPTCTEEGYTTYTCSICGDSYVDDKIEATGHSWDEGVVTTAATCTEDGEKTYICTMCGETKTETIAATGHSYEAVVTDPTCTEKGYTTYTCSVCGDSYTVDETEATGHISSDAAMENEVAATCTVDGSYDSVVYCTVCGGELSRDTVTVPATGHSFGEWETIISPTCEDTGSEKRSCTVCGYTETRDVEPTGHDWEEDYTVDVEAGCTTDGSKSIHCRNCAAVKDSEVIPATGHVWDEGAAVSEAACEETGSMLYTCTVCQETKTEPIPASGHTLTHVASNAATCTGEGNTEYWYCEDCGKYFSDETAGAEISLADTVVPATGHSYGEWETVTSPTCEDTGSEKRSCTVCGYTETRDVEPTGHDWEEDYTVDVEATCVTDGSRSIHCRNCEAVKDSEVIPATGHSYEAVVTEPTYTEQGYTVYTCTNCGDSYITDYTAIKVVDGTDGNLNTKITV